MLEEAPQVENVGGDEAGQAVIVRYENEEVLVEVEGHRGGFSFSTTRIIGWRAFVDGAAIPILQANHVFGPSLYRPVLVRCTSHSDSVRWGGWISGIGWFCWMVVCFGPRWVGSCLCPPRMYSPVGPLPSPVGRALVVLLYGACVRWSLWSGALSRMQALINWGDSLVSKLSIACRFWPLSPMCSLYAQLCSWKGAVNSSVPLIRARRIPRVIHCLL